MKPVLWFNADKHHAVYRKIIREPQNETTINAFEPPNQPA